MCDYNLMDMRSGSLSVLQSRSGLRGSIPQTSVRYTDMRNSNGWPDLSIDVDHQMKTQTLSCVINLSEVNLHTLSCVTDHSKANHSL